MSLLHTLVVALRLLSTVALDAVIALLNIVLPNKRKGSVIPPGRPGHAGVWPEYRAPERGASRSPCPAINALANHGILPRDGKNIRFADLERTVQQTYNFSPTFCFFVPYYFAQLCGKDYNTDTLDLADLAQHNAIEHDASFCREDVAYSPDQSAPAPALIQRLLDSASGSPHPSTPAKATDEKRVRTPEPTLTLADLARFGSIRRAECRAANPSFTLAPFHKIFGSANASTMVSIFGGDLPALRTMLLEERIPDGWESACRSPFGLSMAAFNKYVLGVELRVDEARARREMASKKKY